MSNLSETLGKLLGRGEKAGRVDHAHGTHRTMPWNQRTDDCVYTGLDKSVWMYRVIDNAPLRFADDDELEQHQASIRSIIQEIGRTSIAGSGPFGASLGMYRNLHLLTVRWEQRAEPPPSTPTRALSQYLEREVLTYTAPQQLVFIGVQIIDLAGAAAARAHSPLDVLKDLIDDLWGDSVTDHDRLSRHRDYLHNQLARVGCRIPTKSERRQLEAWFNRGSHAEPEIIPYPDHLLVNRRDRIQMAALANAGTPRRPPHQEWLSDVMDHPNGPTVVSIRAQLQPGADVKKTAKRNVKQREKELEKVSATNQDPDADELTDEQLARMVRDYYAQAPDEVAFYNTSIVFGRRLRDDDATHDSFISMLEDDYDIEAVPLVQRQIQALHETMPCSALRSHTFTRHLNLDSVTYAGLAVFTDVGDDAGAHVGQALPDRTPVYWSASASSRSDAPPVTLLVGVPGSGKSLQALHMAFQTCLGGQPVSFVNPKANDEPMASILPFFESEGIPTEWTSLSQIASSGGEGVYDPFRYATTPETAATLASGLITTMLTEFDQAQRNELRRGLRVGANSGARSTLQALRYVEDNAVEHQVRSLWESTPQFAVLIGDQPRERMGHELGAEEQQAGKFLLTELDIDLDIPQQIKEHYTDDERLALTLLRGITSANVGMLAGRTGGMFAIDEAHVLLSNPTIVERLKRIAREGRSLNVAQVYMTQLASDLLAAGQAGGSLESFVERVFALRMTDPQEAAAALRLVGYEPTRERIQQMANDFKPRATDAGVRPPMCYHTDLQGRKALLSVPIPERFRDAASTNVADRIARDSAA